MIRKLVARDLFTVGNMLKKVLPDMVGMDFKGLDGEDEGQKSMRIGKQFIPLLVDKCFSDFWTWLADLTGKTVDEFNAMPVEYPAEVIAELTENEDLKRFFLQAGRLTK